MDKLFAIELFATIFLTGLIWTIQIVHYPSFKFVHDKEYLSFQKFHMRAITYIVGPMMLIELLLSGFNLYRFRSDFFIINFILVALIWFNTALWNIPIHNKLTDKKDVALIKELVLSNWPRTILWSLKSLLLLYFLR